MANHSSMLAWRIPWAEEPGGLQSMGFKESDTTEDEQPCIFKKCSGAALKEELSHTYHSPQLTDERRKEDFLPQLPVNYKLPTTCSFEKTNKQK